MVFMARRFQFRLQTLLKVRQLREREAKRRVAAKRGEIARVDELRRQTSAELTRQQEALLGEQLQGHLDTLALQRGRAWIAHLRKTIVALQARRAALLSELEQLQSELRVARTQTRIIEKLRERRWQAYARARARREQAEADELARQLQGQELADSADGAPP